MLDSKDGVRWEWVNEFPLLSRSTAVASSTLERNKATLIRSPERIGKKEGLGNALIKPSRHKKSFDLAEALYHSYYKDIRFLLTYCLLLLIGLVIFESVDTMHCVEIHPDYVCSMNRLSFSNAVLTESCPFKKT